MSMNVPPTALLGKLKSKSTGAPQAHHEEHGQEEAEQEEQAEAVCEGVQLQPPHAHAVRSRPARRQGGLQQERHQGSRPEEEGPHDGQNEAGREVQDRQDEMVLPETENLESFTLTFYLFR